MKNKFKLMNSLLSAIAIAPFATTIASCSKDEYESLAEQWTDEAIDKFVNVVCPVHRPTFHTKAIQEAIVEYLVTKCGYTEQQITVGTKYKGGDEKDGGQNIMFDIPATKGYENAPFVGLQGHMDMVCKGTCVKEEVGVEPVIDGDYIHSKDWQSSLGADNGIGLAIMLALAKNPNLIPHPKLRIFMTADEEDGDGGAVTIKEETTDWLAENPSNPNSRKVKYFFNIDQELVDTITTACGGVRQAQLATVDPDTGKLIPGVVYTPVKLTEGQVSELKQYQFNIEGLMGLHSADAHKVHSTSALKVMADLGLTICSVDKTANLLMAVSDPIFVEAPEGGHWESQGSGGTVASSCRMVINTILDYDEIKDLVDLKLNDYKLSYPEEKNLKINYFKLLFPYEYGMSASETHDLLQLIWNLPFGIVQQHKTYDVPATSMNIGPLVVPPFTDGKDKEVTLEIFGRSFYEENLASDNGLIMNLVQNVLTNVFKKDNITFDPSVGYNCAWDIEPQTTVNKLIHQAADKFGYEMKDIYELGWLESAAFKDLDKFKHKDKAEMEVTSIGPLVEHYHETKETVYIPSIVQLLKMLIYALEQICHMN